MLVFTRKLDEAIVIGDGIEVRVLRLGRDQIRIGVTCPRELSVSRGEKLTRDHLRAHPALRQMEDEERLRLGLDPLTDEERDARERDEPSL